MRTPVRFLMNGPAGGKSIERVHPLGSAGLRASPLPLIGRSGMNGATGAQAVLFSLIHAHVESVIRATSTAIAESRPRTQGECRGGSVASHVDHEKERSSIILQKEKKYCSVCLSGYLTVGTDLRMYTTPRGALSTVAASEPSRRTHAPSGIPKSPPRRGNARFWQNGQTARLTSTVL